MILKDKKDIVAWLSKYHITNYKLIEDAQYGFRVDVEGSVYLEELELVNIEVKFGSVSRNFSCSSNKLTSLLGSPDTVVGYFYCSNNLLTSLEHCPQKVDSFSCDNNLIRSLEYSPREITGYFSCERNLLTSLEHCPKVISYDLYAKENKIETLIHLPVMCDNIYLEGNSALEDYWHISNLKDLKEISDIYKERAALSAIESSSTKKIIKL